MKTRINTNRTTRPLATPMIKAMMSALPALLALASGAAAQTDVLYASTNGGSDSLYRIQGAAVTGSVNRSGSGEAGLAVWGDVRTTGLSGGTGGRYDLALAYQGTPYAFTGSPKRFDGTSDGAFNYAFAYPSRDVYRYDRDWQNETYMCTLPTANNIGITYDTQSGLFWGVNLAVARTVFSFDLTGAVHTSFIATGSPPFQDTLAYEPTTDTLWTVSQGFGQDPYLSQYTKAGVRLQQFQIPGFTDQAITGIEFDLIPAPGSAALLGLAGLIAGRRRRLEGARP